MVGSGCFRLWSLFDEKEGHPMESCPMEMSSLNIPEEPERFRELCEKTGLALMLGQKVQFALSYYYSVFHKTHGNFTEEKVKEKLEFHLSKPLGVVVDSIEKAAPLGDELFSKVRSFQAERNWLAHDFDQEMNMFRLVNEADDEGGTPDLSPWISRLEKISEQACEIIAELVHVGEKLAPIGIQNPCRR